MMDKPKIADRHIKSEPPFLEFEGLFPSTICSNGGYPAYCYIEPILLMLTDEIPLIISHSFRQGNETEQVIEVIKKAYELLPEGKKISLACLDSEFYNTEVIEYLREKDTKFCIVVDKTSSVRDLINRIDEWKPFKDRDGIQTEKEIGETVHTMNRLGFSFRMWLQTAANR